jgi:hypothetical protein
MNSSMRVGNLAWTPASEGCLKQPIGCDLNPGDRASHLAASGSRACGCQSCSCEPPPLRLLMRLCAQGRYNPVNTFLIAPDSGFLNRILPLAMGEVYREDNPFRIHPIPRRTEARPDRAVSLDWFHTAAFGQR